MPLPYRNWMPLARGLLRALQVIAARLELEGARHAGRT
jgi:hypothetical protein